MPRRTRGTGRRGGGVIQGLKRQINALKNVDKGRVYTPRGNPPGMENARWYQASLSHIDTDGDATYTVNDFANLARDQNGLFATDVTNRVPIELRFLSVECWQCGNSLTTREFQVIIYDPVNAQPLHRLYANQGYVRFGSVGFMYPRSISNVPLSSENKNTVLKVDVPGTNTVIIHCKFLWRSINGEGFNLSHSWRQPPPNKDDIEPGFDALSLGCSSTT